MKRRRILQTCAVVVMPLLIVGLFLGFLRVSGNFHEVAKAELYRSAQPTSAQMQAYAEGYGIRTIINLRGKSSKADWYKSEIDTAKKLGILHIDFKMSAQRELAQDESDRLIEILRDAPKPILIHCQAGADRSGLVAAIYLHAIKGVDVETAERQISIRYGHVGIPYLSSTFAMDTNWERLERQFQQAKL